MLTDVKQRVELVLAVPGDEQAAYAAGQWLREQLPGENGVELPEGRCESSWSVVHTQPREVHVPVIVDRADYDDACELALAAVRRVMADAPVRARSVCTAPRRLEWTDENRDAVLSAYAAGETAGRMNPR